MNRKGYEWKAFAVVVASLAVAAFFVYRYVSGRYVGEETRIYIASQSGVGGLHDSLVGSLGEDYGGRVFNLWEKIADNDHVRSGSYIVRTGDKAWRLARRIRNGQQDPVRVTFNNIRTFEQLCQTVGSQLEINAEEFSMAADSVASSRGLKSAQRGALFMPDTYELYWNVPADKAVGKIVENYDRFWNDERMAKAARLGLTPADVATVASIVEDETSKADERPKVARLYLNRLATGMKLQADPTVKFALGDFGLRRITNNHLRVNSPYNTYLHKGLPPGPIRIPAKGTLEAVINAPLHNYIYMCAKEDFSGYHNFSSSYEQHLQNARRYQNALNQRGIR